MFVHEFLHILKSYGAPSVQNDIDGFWIQWREKKEKISEFMTSPFQLIEKYTVYRNEASSYITLKYFCNGLGGGFSVTCGLLYQIFHGIVKCWYD